MLQAFVTNVLRGWWFLDGVFVAGCNGLVIVCLLAYLACLRSVVLPLLLIFIFTDKFRMKNSGVIAALVKISSRYLQSSMLARWKIFLIC